MADTIQSNNTRQIMPQLPRAENYKLRGASAHYVQIEYHRKRRNGCYYLKFITNVLLTIVNEIIHSHDN